MFNNLKIKSEFNKNVIKLMTGTTIAQIIAFLSQPLLTRLFTPIEYGLYSSIQSFIIVFSAVAALCYERAIVLVEDDDDALSLAALSCKCIIVFSFVIILLMIIPGLWHSLFAMQLKWYYFLVIPVWAFAVAINNVFINLNTRFKLFSLLSKRQIKSSLILAIIQLGSGFLKFGIFGLLFANCVAVIYSVYITSQGFFNRTLNKINNNSKSLMFKYKSFPIYQLPSIFLDTLSAQMAVILLNKLLGPAIAGQYALANKVLMVPLMLIGSAFAQVFYQEFATRYYNNDNPRVFLINTWKKLFLLGILPGLILFVWGQPLFIFIFGSHWQMAGWFAQYLSIMAFIMLISSPTSTALIVIGLQKYQIIFCIYVLIIRAAFIFLMQYNLVMGLVGFICFEILGIVAYNILILYKM